MIDPAAYKFELNDPDKEVTIKVERDRSLLDLWNFRDEEYISIHVSMKVRSYNDRDRPGARRIKVEGQRSVPACIDEKHFMKEVRSMIMSLVLHEMDEWLHCNGMRIVDPHPDTRPEDPRLAGERFWT